MQHQHQLQLVALRRSKPLQHAFKHLSTRLKFYNLSFPSARPSATIALQRRRCHKRRRPGKWGENRWWRWGSCWRRRLWIKLFRKQTIRWSSLVDDVADDWEHNSRQPGGRRTLWGDGEDRAACGNLRYCLSATGDSSLPGDIDVLQKKDTAVCADDTARSWPVQLPHFHPALFKGRSPIPTPCYPSRRRSVV